jgi:RimJ/RimL family protein N-acetyltransferase
MHREPQSSEVEFRFKRIFDYATIQTTLTHEKLYAAMADDFSPPREKFMARMDDNIWYITVVAGPLREYMGMFCFMPESHIRWRLHTCLLPCAWGRSVEIMKAVFQWLWENTQCERLITDVPVYNRLALRLGKAAGMEFVGVDKQSIKKGGKLHDQILLGLSRCQSTSTTCLSSAVSVPSSAESSAATPPITPEPL